MGQSDIPNSETVPTTQPSESSPEAANVPLAEGLKHDVNLIRIPPHKQPAVTPSAEADLLPDPEERLNHRSPDQLNKARKRQAVFLQKRRKQKKRQVLLARVRGLIRVGFALLLLLGLYGLKILPIWSVPTEAVQIEGTALLQPRHLLPRITPELAHPIYQINPIQLETQIKQAVSLVDDIHIRRRLFPTGLLVVVAEKPYWGTLYNDETGLPQYWLHTDGTTTPVAQFYQAGKDTMPDLRSTVRVYGQMAQLPQTQRKRIQTLVELLSAPSRGAVHLRAIDMRNPQEVWAQFDGYKARLGHADALLIRRSTRILDVAPALASRKAAIQYVDLRWNNQILLKQKTPEQIKQEAQAKAQQAKLAAEKAAQAAKLKASQPAPEPLTSEPLPASAPGVTQ